MSTNKKIKFTTKVKELGSKLQWVLFSELQDYKLTSDYIDLICPDPKKAVSNPTEKLESMVKESLIKEFSPQIKNSKSFDLLVDAVTHNIKKKSFKD